MAFPALLRNFEKNYLSYKPFYLRTLKQILDFGISPSNFFYVNTDLNISDKYTRVTSMEPFNLDQILGKFENGSFDLKSSIFGHFDVQKYFNEIENPPPFDFDCQIPGVYEHNAQVFLNITTQVRQVEQVKPASPPLKAPMDNLQSA